MSKKEVKQQIITALLAAAIVAGSLFIAFSIVELFYHYRDNNLQVDYFEIDGMTCVSVEFSGFDGINGIDCDWSKWDRPQE